MRTLAPALHRLSFRRFHPELDFRPNGCAPAGPVGESTRDDTGFHFAFDHRVADFERRRRVVSQGSFL